MHRYGIIIALCISSVQSSQREAVVPPLALYVESGASYNVLRTINQLNCYDIYKNENKFRELNNQFKKGALDYCSMLWALGAWYNLYECHGPAGINPQATIVVDYETSIANKIKELANKGAHLQGVFRSGLRWYKEYKAKHILHYLFELPCYSSVMHDLWQDIKIRPTKEIINYGDEDSTFLDDVFKRLQDNQPDIITKLTFLWRHNFLPADWLKKLELKILEEYLKTNKDLKKIYQQNRFTKKKKKEDTKAICLKINLSQAKQALSQLLQQDNYREKLFHEHKNNSLVDVVFLKR
jgi:hypothetical protein